MSNVLDVLDVLDVWLFWFLIFPKLSLDQMSFPMLFNIAVIQFAVIQFLEAATRGVP